MKINTAILMELDVITKMATIKIFFRLHYFFNKNYPDSFEYGSSYLLFTYSDSINIIFESLLA